MADLDQHHVAVRVRRSRVRRAPRRWRRWRRRRAATVRSATRRCSGTSIQPRFGAATTVPSASTMPGDPMPMPSTGAVAAATETVDEGEHLRRRLLAPAAGELHLDARSGSRPSMSSTAPRNTACSLRSMPMIWVAARFMSSSTAGLPGRASSRWPSSMTRPSAISSGDQVGDGDAGEARLAGEVGAAHLARSGTASAARASGCGCARARGAPWCCGRSARPGTIPRSGGSEPAQRARTRVPRRPPCLLVK